MQRVNGVSQSEEMAKSEFVSLVEEKILQCLIDEVTTSPKPGLVDFFSTGSHHDMDWSLFMQSAHTIAPYLSHMAQVGYDWHGKSESLFQAVRFIGIEAEQAMLQTTHGINTHKGALFTLGLLCTATGFMYHNTGYFDVFEVLDYISHMTSAPLQREFDLLSHKKNVTHGEKLYLELHEGGIRSEAMAGFPSLKKSYAYLHLLKTVYHDENRMNVQVLLLIMSTLFDTNVVSRGGVSGLHWVQQEVNQILTQGGALLDPSYRSIVAFDKACIEKNISSGGAADLLSATIFLTSLEAALNS